MSTRVAEERDERQKSKHVNFVRARLRARSNNKAFFLMTCSSFEQNRAVKKDLSCTFGVQYLRLIIIVVKSLGDRVRKFPYQRVFLGGQ